MRKYHALVFDDFVVSTTTVFTKPELNDVLGQNDQMAIQCITDQVTTSNGTITVRLQHSSDQINWINKNGTAEINGSAINTASTNVTFGNDAGGTPSLGYVRFSILITTATQAHVKLWVTGRNQG
jgi:hypothetical protein